VYLKQYGQKNKELTETCIPAKTKPQIKQIRRANGKNELKTVKKKRNNR
jgi:hypothetical protein